MVSPIKIKICDRNSLMGLSYEYKLVKVEQANGTVVVKNEKDVLKTDTILAYLPNDYTAPIRVKILDINIVYAMAEVLRLIVNYGHNIPEKFAIVYEYIKMVTKLVNRNLIAAPLTYCYGETNEPIKFKATIVTALDIFKEIGLFAGFKIKAIASGLTKVWSPFKTKIIAKADIPGAIRTVYTTIASRLIHKTNMEKAIEVYYAYPVKMIIFAAKAKCAVAEFVHEDEAVSRVSQKTLADRLLTVNYRTNSSDKNKLLLSMHGITQGVVKTKKRIKEIDDLTLKDIKDNNMTLDDILYKYS